MNKISDKRAELIEMGKRLRELRDTKGKSQKEAAGDLYLKQSVLSSYEIGDREPSIITLNKIARYYNVTVDYLTGNNEFKSVQHERLQDAEIFSQDTISKLNELLPEELNFLETILCTSGFNRLLLGLKRYHEITFEEIEKYGRNLFGNDSPALKLRIALSKDEIKKDILKPVLDRSLSEILDELSSIEVKTAHQFYITEVEKTIENEKRNFNEELKEKGFIEEQRVKILLAYEEKLREKFSIKEV